MPPFAGELSISRRAAIEALNYKIQMNFYKGRVIAPDAATLPAD